MNKIVSMYLTFTAKSYILKFFFYQITEITKIDSSTKTRTDLCKKTNANSFYK